MIRFTETRCSALTRPAARVRALKMFAAAGGLVLASLCSAAPAAAQSPTLVSVNKSGTGAGFGGSNLSSVSGDGRYVAFQSEATDIVPVADSNFSNDIFVRDMRANSTRLLSVSSAGNSTGNCGSNFPLISGNGRLVAFNSSASNLAPPADANNQNDVFASEVPPPADPLALLTEEGSNRAVALDSVTMMRDPFPLTTTHNFSADGRTRIMLFAANLKSQPGAVPPVVTAHAEDSAGAVHELPVEHAMKVPNFD